MSSTPSAIDTTRLESQLSTAFLHEACVAVIGVGGSMTKLESPVRCGVRKFILCDFDVVEPSNVARQGHDAVGQLKVEAATRRLQQINPQVRVTQVPLDCTTLSDDEADELFGPANLIIVTVDRFAADAWANRLALRLNKPAMWIGIYEKAGAAEIVFWHPGLDACFRCLLEHRYNLHEQAARDGVSLDPPSDGTLFQDTMIVAGLAGHVALGLLTRGADNFFGRLIDALGDRNFLQLKLRHDWLLNACDPVREVLGVSAENDTYLCWNTIARRNGPSAEPCPDCEQYRGHRFEIRENEDGMREIIRIRPDNEAKRANVEVVDQTVAVTPDPTDIDSVPL